MLKIHVLKGLLIRHIFLYPKSAPRIAEIFYWPIISLVLWGFITRYVNQISAVPGLDIIKLFLGALIFWDLFHRSQQSISISFLEDLWSRNLMNIFTAPVSHWDFIIATIILSLLKLIVLLFVLIPLAYLLYAFNFFSIGLAIIPFMINLMLFSWTMGIIATGIILRFGRQLDIIAWTLPILIQPFSAVFYPVEVLPAPLRVLSFFLPPAHTFEGLRSLLNQGTFEMEQVVIAFLLNIIYLAGIVFVFNFVFKQAREKGLLVRIATQ